MFTSKDIRLLCLMSQMNTMKLILKILLGLSIIPLLWILFVWLAFGPISSSGKINFEDDNEIHYEERYIGDFANTFYEIQFFANDKQIGSHTFHNQNWSEHYITMQGKNKTYMIFADSSLNGKRLNEYYILSFEKDFINASDTNLNLDQKQHFLYQIANE